MELVTSFHKYVSLLYYPCFIVGAVFVDKRTYMFVNGDLCGVNLYYVGLFLCKFELKWGGVV